MTTKIVTPEIHHAMSKAREEYAAHSIDDVQTLVTAGYALYEKFGCIPFVPQAADMAAFGAMLTYNLVTDAKEFRSGDLIAE